MTNEDAIAELKTSYCAECPVAIDNNACYENECEIFLSIEALEKQIPKKAQKITKGCYVCLGNCPNCKNNITDYTSHRFCKECGQKLDWSGEK